MTEKKYEYRALVIFGITCLLWLVLVGIVKIAVVDVERPDAPIESLKEAPK